MRTKPVLLGPLTFLLLAKPDPDVAGTGDFDRLRHQLLEPLLAVYAEVLRRLEALGADWVQLDEPVLALDLRPERRAAFGPAYQHAARAAPRLRLMVATYFAPLADNLEAFLRAAGRRACTSTRSAARAELPAAAASGSPAGARCRWGWSTGATSGGRDLLAAWSQLERARAAVGRGDRDGGAVLLAAARALTPAREETAAAGAGPRGWRSPRRSWARW